ncbi:hypothetical protein SeLEV6574_g07411 [Synchytrium endobioticum]|uniref:Uncharacterized protein n=1 Tax=Synchytrium endobioticum TaxID=286115 RepID=A0A507CHR5_9FUNG|nr:hypothetical protein SeLEV6574_g07411 [Synchytrium endobioticum]
MATQVSLSPEIARRIPGEVNAVYNAMVQVRRHLHALLIANPELGYEEYETAKLIVEKLRGMTGLEIYQGVGNAIDLRQTNLLYYSANPLSYQLSPSGVQSSSLKLQISPKLKDVMRVTSRNPNPQTNPSTIGELLLCPTILRLTNCRAIPISRARFMAFRDSGFVGSQFGSSSLYIM